MNTKNKIIIIFAALLMFVSRVNVHAIEYSGFGGRPANSDPNNPRTESIFIYTLSPEEKKEDGVRIINNSQVTKTFNVYATDSTPSTGGAFACKQFLEDQTGVGSWIKLAKSEVTLPAGQNEIVPFTISTPENVSVGEHNGCILIQEKKSEATASGVNISMRTGLRVVVTIPGNALRSIVIESFTLSKKDDGSILFHPKLKNEGNVSIDTDVSVVTRYFFGKEFLTQGGQYPVFRGEIGEWNFELKRPFWGGWYKSDLTVSYDNNYGAGVGQVSGKTLTRLESPTLWFFVTPTPAALAIEIIIILLLLALLGLWLFSVRRWRWIANHWVSHKVIKSENIQELAKRYNVSWKLLAKVNSIEPPYVVEAGKIIKVPPASYRAKHKRNNGK